MSHTGYGILGLYLNIPRPLMQSLHSQAIQMKVWWEDISCTLSPPHVPCYKVAAVCVMNHEK